MKRLLFLTHRWGGVALALFMFIWLFSGLVIMYASPMTPNRTQQQQRAETLLVQPNWLSLGEVWERSREFRCFFISNRAGKGNIPKVEPAILEARLVRQAGEPRWLIEDTLGQRIALSPIDGVVHRATPEEAELTVAQWLAAEQSKYDRSDIQYQGIQEKPAILRNLDAYKPFHHFSIAGFAGRELYVSSKTGEVVHDSTCFDRVMYWAGNWLHLFRFLDLLGYGESRTDVLMWTVFIAMLATVTGLIVGWLRWRPGWFGKHTYGAGRVQPYRAFWFKWHFWAGLIGGIAAFGWTFSGWLNNNPWQVFSAANPTKAQVAGYYSNGLPTPMQNWRPTPPLEISGEWVELAWRRLGDSAVLLAYDHSGHRYTVKNGIADAIPSSIDEKSIVSAIERLGLGSSVQVITQQDHYDNYYYPRHGRGATDRPLPVMRVEMDDQGATRIYVDPVDGRLLLRQDTSRRAYRWLWSALHHWDIGYLYQRPLWDMWMLFWVGLGLVLSASAVVLGWRRLDLTIWRKNKRTAAAQTQQTSVIGLASKSE